MSNPAAPKIQVKCRLTGKAIVPRPIQMQTPGWGGPAELRMENGSEPQPWHCTPFTDGATYGLELLYPYTMECRVSNADGQVSIAWDHAREIGAKLTGREFSTFPPQPARFFLFQTGLDIEAPPGHVIRVEPHPRFYTDTSGTVPAAVVGHVQTEWWAKTLFVVFKAPPPGATHIFRKGEPYAQVLVVPHRASYEVARMEPDHEARRTKFDRDLGAASPFIAKSVWFNRSGDEFRDHYRVLENAFVSDGQAGVEQTVLAGLQRLQGVTPPPEVPTEDCLKAAYQLQQQGRFVEARALYQHVLQREPENDQAISLWSILAAETKAHDMALQMMRRTVELRPDSAVYHANLGRLLLRLNRAAESEPELRKSLELQPNDPKVMSDLGVVVAQQGRVDEGLDLARAAAAAAPGMAITHFHVGVILANTGRAEESREHLQRALSLSPEFAEARYVLDRLPGAPPATSWENPEPN